MPFPDSSVKTHGSQGSVTQTPTPPFLSFVFSSFLFFSSFFLSSFPLLPGRPPFPFFFSTGRPPFSPPSPVSLSLSLHFSSVDWPPSSSTPPGVARGQARRRRRPSRRPLPSLSPPTPLSLARARAHHRRRDGTGRLGLPASGSSPASLPPDSPPSSSPRIRPAPTGSTPPPCARRWGAGRRRPGGTAGGLAAAIGFGLPSALGTQAQGPGDVVAGYYQQLLEMLGGFNEMDTLTDRGFLHGMSKEERDQVARSEKLAIQLSNIANMVLFAAKVYASIRSGSLAIIASTLDSLLDLLSGFILWFTAFSMQTPNPYRYLIGKRRMQALRILVFASVMATLGLRIILESICSLLSDGYEFHLTNKQGKWVVDIMLSVTLVKLLLVIYCRSFTNEIVKAYAQDHLFDVITNVIGLVAALLANYVEGWIDPVGAIIRSIQSGHGR